MNIKTLLLLLLAFNISQINAQEIKLSKQEQISDLSNYMEVLKNKHIGLYRYSSKKEIEETYNNLVESIIDSNTQVEFYKTVCKLNAEIKCGHTIVNHPHNIIKSQALLPFTLFYVENKFYVQYDKTVPCKHIKHKQVISIDDKKIDLIIDNIKDYYSPDGYIETRKNIFTLNLFPIYFARLIDTNSTHEIVFLDSIGKYDTLVVKSISYNNLIGNKFSKNEEKKVELVKYYTDSISNYTYLGLNTFYIKPDTFKTIIDSLFLVINKDNPENLVIDLRGNTGGKIKNEYLLMSYLINNRLKVPLKRYRLDTNNRKWPFSREKINPQTNAYSGNLYFLMDGYSFSAAAEFLSIAQYLKLGIFIGEETGGAKDGCNYGKNKYELPNSKLECYIPYHKSVFTKSLPIKGRGIMPDYPIVYSKNDIVNKKDLCILKVNSLIRSSR